MKTSPILATLTSLLLFAHNGAAVTCYSSGDTFTNKGQARGWLEFACRGNGGMFTGNIDGGATKFMCPVQDGGKQVRFTVTNLDGNRRDMDDNFCVTAMTSIIDSCSKGGEDSREGWFMK